jgi:hypothetical protein
MALTIIKNLPSVGLVRNPLVTVLQSDNLIATPGVKFKARLKFGSGGPNDNDTIMFVWNGNEVVMTALQIPNNSGLQFVSYRNYFPGLDDYVATHVLPALRANYLLNEDFTFTFLSDVSDIYIGQILMESRRTGYVYTTEITHNCNGFIAMNDDANDPLYVTPFLGVTEVERENFRIFSDVYVEEVYNSGAYTKVAELKADPDKDAKGIIYIDKVLKSFLTPDIPAFNQNIITSSTGMLKRYFLRSAEAFGVPTQIQYLENPDFIHQFAILAGYSFKGFPQNTFLENYIDATTDRKFLTNLPREREIAPDAQQFLYYYKGKQGNLGSLQLRYNIFYTDGNSAAGTIKTKSSLQQAVYIFPAGMAQLGLQDLDPTKEIDYYELYVQHSILNQTSEYVKFYINRNYFSYSNEFIYLNSFGGFDTIWCTGELEELTEGNAIEYERGLPHDYSANQHAFNAAEVWYQEVYQCYTGVRSDLDYTRQHLKEFLNSECVFWIKDGQFIPVVISDRKIDGFTELDNVKSMSFRFYVAHTNYSYSP